MTLFFLQLFQTLTTNGDSVFGHNVTGGPNGILNVDPFHLFGHNLAVEHGGVFAVSYLYVALAFFVVVYVALRFVNLSRTGRAWRSLREDPLAAEAMGMPVNWLKLMSFAFGAAVAALTGTLFAALNASVFPLTFYFVLLITVYTMVILGGSGSQAGRRARRDHHQRPARAAARPRQVAARLRGCAARGARARVPLLEEARARRRGRRSSSASRYTSLRVRTVRPGWPVRRAAASRARSRTGSSSPRISTRWVAPVSYIGLIAVMLVLTLLSPRVRLVLLVPTLYLAAFVWENVMLAKPEPARYIVLGLILIGLMILRPNGLLGERRVEII